MMCSYKGEEDSLGDINVNVATDAMSTLRGYEGDDKGEKIDFYAFDDDDFDVGHKNNGDAVFENDGAMNFGGNAFEDSQKVGLRETLRKLKTTQMGGDLDDEPGTPQARRKVEVKEEESVKKSTKHTLYKALETHNYRKNPLAFSNLKERRTANSKNYKEAVEKMEAYVKSDKKESTVAKSIARHLAK